MAASCFATKSKLLTKKQKDPKHYNKNFADDLFAYIGVQHSVP